MPKPTDRERRKQILLLGAIDMEQVIAAAEAIQRELASATPERPLIRALEAGLVVCYWRPFSKNGVGRLEPSDALDPYLHDQIRTLRNTVHAHIGTSSGRTAGIAPLVTTTGVGGSAYTESSWEGFPEQWLPRIIEVARKQRDDFRAKASSIAAE